MSGGELILRIVAREFRGRFRSYPTAAPSPITFVILQIWYFWADVCS